MYEIEDTFDYVDEEGHKRMIITIINKSDGTKFDVMVRDTGLVYIMEKDWDDNDDIRR